MSRRALLLVGLALATALALALRLPALNRRPMHVDEAVHAHKFDTLWQTGRYEYDLNEYHGPTIYYAALPLAWLSGARTLAGLDAATFRLVAVVFGAALVPLLLLVADGLGRAATVIAAILTALSTALVFYSRYYIQETLLVCFTLLVLGSAWRFVSTRRAGWLVLAGAGLGLMHATKETCVIALGCMVLALGLTRLWPPRRAREQWPNPDETQDCKGTAPRDRFRGAPGSAAPLRPGVILLALFVASLVSAALFSGFLTNPRGPLDSVRAFATYFQRAGEGGLHEHPWYYYLHILTFWRAGAGPIWSEGVIVALALVGAVFAWRRRPSGDTDPRLMRFMAVYGVLLTVGYSAIPYKTPWCLLSMLHVMVLLAGFGITALWHCVHRAGLRVALGAVFALACLHLGWQTWRANSVKYCNSGRNPYVYAQTLYAAEDLAKQLQAVAHASPHGSDILVKVVVENCWPLPWYLRAFNRVGYWSDVPVDPDADVILASARVQATLEPRLRDTYEVSHCGLRADERLLVYVRRALWQAYIARAHETPVR